MERFLGRYSEIAYVIMRVVLAFDLLTHAIQKFTGAFGGPKVPLVSLLGLAGVIELVGSPLLALGLFTPVVTFLFTCEMVGAYYIVHYPRGGVPLQNRGEIV